MLQYARAINWFLVTALGLNLRVFSKTIIGLPKYFLDTIQFLITSKSSTFKFRLKPCIGDHLTTSGVESGEYFYQDLLAAQLIFAGSSRMHLDIGSRIDGFVLGVAAFRELTVLDIRASGVKNKNVRFVHGDITSKDLIISQKYDSISCLHTLEHIGLGRYGDDIDCSSYLNALENIANILTPGGRFYLSVPIGKKAVYFNSNRVFSLPSLIDELKSFCLLLDCFFVINSDSSLSIPIDQLDLGEFEDVNYQLCLLVLKKDG